jgi:mxaJ protein
MRSGSAIARAILAFTALMGTCAIGQSQERTTLRVCADPNNLPFSDRNGRGFENKLAEMIATELQEHVAYTWWAQRRGFIRNTLKAGDCDVVVGVPFHYDLVTTTKPYYRSSYVFVSRADRNLRLTSLQDPRLHSLKIGVHLIGDDGVNTPPAHALGDLGIIDNVTGFSIYGDYRERAPPARLIEAVERGEIDVATAWGPLAGYVARQSPVPLAIAPIADGDVFKPLAFQFDIAMGVRNGDQALRNALDLILARKQETVRSILLDYGVPLLFHETPE